MCALILTECAIINQRKYTPLHEKGHKIKSKSTNGDYFKKLFVLQQDNDLEGYNKLQWVSEFWTPEIWNHENTRIFSVQTETEVARFGI